MLLFSINNLVSWSSNQHQKLSKIQVWCSSDAWKLMLHVLCIQASYHLCLCFLYHKKFQIWPFIQFLDLLSPGHLTSKSDVYSFGVVLLEILTGRRSMDKKRPSGQQNLVAWARQFLLDKRKLDLLVDHRLERHYSIKGVQKVSQLAYNCLSKDPKSRPTMDEVVRVLTTLQDLNDLAILSCHSRLPQQGRRKKKDGTPQLTYNQSRSIRDSPLNTGRQHCRWWAVTSPWLAQLFDKTKGLDANSFHWEIVRRIYFKLVLSFGCLKLARAAGSTEEEGTSVSFS